MNRDIIRNQIRIICIPHPRWVETVSCLIEDMEASCFDAAVDEATEHGITPDFSDVRFKNRYSAICGRVISALDPHGIIGYSGFIDSVLSGEIPAKSVGRLTSVQLNPKASATERAELEVRKRQKAAPKTLKLARCSKCGGREITKAEYQSRAADESNTHSFKCLNPACGHVWRKS